MLNSAIIPKDEIEDPSYPPTSTIGPHTDMNPRSNIYPIGVVPNPYSRHLTVSANQGKRLLFEEIAQIRSIELPPFQGILPLTFAGTLNESAVRDSLTELVRRHAALRTAFEKNPVLPSTERLTRIHKYIRTGLVAPGLYKQIVFADVQIDLHVRTVREGVSTESEIRRIVDQEVAIPFDYATPPLIRAILVKIEPATNLLILVVHHLISDVWSLRVLRRELNLLYRFFSTRDRRGNYPLPPLAIQDHDFTAWQHKAFQAGYFYPAISYWRRYWDRFDSAWVRDRDLPVAQANPRIQTFQSDIQRSILGRHEALALEVFTREMRITRYMLFLAAFGVVLNRSTGKAMIAVLGNFSNRARPEVQNIVGWLTNSHLVGVDLTHDCSARELLLQTRTTVLNAIANQYIPLVFLWRALGRSLNKHEGIVVCDDLTDSSSDTISGFILNEASFPAKTYAGSLRAMICSRSGGTELALGYSKERFSPEAIRELLEGLRSTVMEMIRAPDTRVSDL